jgi:hypothetical protein
MPAAESYLTVTGTFLNLWNTTTNLSPHFCLLSWVKWTAIAAKIFTKTPTWNHIGTIDTALYCNTQHSLNTSIRVTIHTMTICRSHMTVSNLMKDHHYIFYDAHFRARNVKVLIWLHDSILWITNELILSHCLPYRTACTHMWPPVRALSSLPFTLPR